MRSVLAFVRDVRAAAKGLDSSEHAHRRQFDRRRFISPGTALLYVIVLGFASVGFGTVQSVQSAMIDAQRAGCEDVNALRVNQALAIKEQIAQTEVSLKGSLGSLEPFREQIVAGIAQREARLARIRRTVADHPLRGRDRLRVPVAERPYREACSEAYP